MKVRIYGDPDMRPETLAALRRMMELVAKEHGVEGPLDDVTIVDHNKLRFDDSYFYERGEF